MMNKSFLKYFFQFTSSKYTTTTFAGMLLWRKHLTLVFYLLYLFLIYWVIFSILGGPHMLKYFITSLWFWGFAPIAGLLIVLFFITGLLGFAEIGLNFMQWIMPWGLPVMFGRIFVILLLLFLLSYFITVIFRIILICIDNGFRGTGFCFAAAFFLIRAFFRYYSAGIWIQGILVLLYEFLIELISLFYLFYWSLKRNFLKKSKVFISFMKKRDIGLLRFIVSKILFFILNRPLFKRHEIWNYYRRLFGWVCYSYYIKRLQKSSKDKQFSVIEHRQLCLKYMDTTFNVTDDYNDQLIANRRYLFHRLELIEDKEPEIWNQQMKKLL